MVLPLRAASVWLLVALLCAAGRPVAAETVGPALDRLQAALARSPAGRALLESLSRGGRDDPRIGLEGLVASLEREVGELTGRLVDLTDPSLEVAALALRRVPRELRQEPVVAVMVLLDEWSRVAAAPEAARVDRSSSLVERLRREHGGRDTASSARVATSFPILFGKAGRIASAVGLGALSQASASRLGGRPTDHSRSEPHDLAGVCDRMVAGSCQTGAAGVR